MLLHHFIGAWAGLASQCVAVNWWGAQEPLAAPSISTAHGRHLTHDLFGFHKNITEIESITYNEKEICKWLASNLESQGYEVERQWVDKKAGRFNIFAHFGNRDAKVLVSSHIDTVPPFIPYNRSDGFISGRGSVDAKGSVAAQLIAVNKLVNSGKVDAKDLSLLFVVGEETGGDGMRAANALELKPQTIVFGEPTEGKLVSGHKGNMGFTIYAKGHAAHSGYPWLGRSANEILVKSLAAVIELGPSLPRSEKYGHTTVNIGMMEGGIAGNVVPESAMAKVTGRLAAGTPEIFKKQITHAIHLAVESFLEDDMIPEDVVELEWASHGYSPIDIDHDVPGFEVLTVNYGTDIPWLDRTVEGQKRYLYGPGTIFVAHGANEGLQEDDLTDAVNGYTRIILHALGKE